MKNPRRAADAPSHHPTSSRPLDRRTFLGRTLATGAALAIPGLSGSTAPLFAQDPPKSGSDALRIAGIGVGHKGRHNLDELAGEAIVTLCDVDARFLGEAASRWPDARQYRDYRKMFEAEGGQIDAVVISTADHSHAPATAIALELGLPVYCEKPLTHTVTEARAIASLAAKKKVATQMGTQIHATDNYRRVVEWVRSGVIGDVTAVHCWCNKGWSDGRFAAPSEAPAHVDWDLWLGPAAERPYSPNVHPTNWRRFWDYGAGTFGDMACHIIDLPFWALELTYPSRVKCEGPEAHAVGAPAWTKATYEFPAGAGKSIQLTWSDGGHHFDVVRDTKDVDGNSLAKWGLGILFVGTEGMLAADYGRRQLLPADKVKGFVTPPQTIPDSIGHWNEWVQAVKTGSPTTCAFDYAGPLTETVLLGIVAHRTGKELVWDAKNLRATGCPEADRYLAKEYRKGFGVSGL